MGQEKNEIVEGMGERAVRGVINSVTGIVELPVQTHKGYQKGFSFVKNKPLSKTIGTVLGVFRGLGHAAGRTTYGVLELATFWAAAPEDNDGVGIPLDAEYAWEAGEAHSLFKPNLKEGCAPMGRKLVRGAINGFLGVLELPGQAKKGFQEKKPLQGIVKGVWFWWSRQVYGIGEATLFLVPNPKDIPGYSYSEAWPWDALQSE